MRQNKQRNLFYLSKFSLVEAQKNQLRQQCREMLKLIDSEERNINLFQQERDRINYIWMLQKKKIEETRAELVNKQREKEDLSEKHKIEKKLYYQRIKYQMLTQQDENVELQKNAEVALKQTEDTNRVKERDYKYDLRSLSKTHKEQEVLQNDFLNALKKDSIKAIHDLKSEYELKEFQIRRFYREKMKEMKNNATEKRNKKLEEITNKKAKEIKKITEDHANAFNNMKNYYSDLNKKNLNNLKNIAAHYNKQLNRQEVLRKKKLNRLQQKSKIEVPLEKLRLKIEELLNEEKKCLENYHDLTGKNEEHNTLIKQLLDYEYKYEVIFQKISYLEKEKINFVNKYKDTLHETQQKSGLRVKISDNFILEKKLETLEDNLEVKEVQLKELMKRTTLDPAAMANITNTYEEVELMKGELINQLEDELKRIKEAHINMIRTYEAKLAEFGIPVEEMGFEPLIPVDVEEKEAVNMNRYQ